MKSSNLSLFVFLIQFACLMASCSEKRIVYKDKFYNSKFSSTSATSRRLPLLKPYELEENIGWWLSFVNEENGYAIADKLYVNSQRGFITGYGKLGDITVGGRSFDNISYFVIDVTQKKEFIPHDSTAFFKKLKEEQLPTDSFLNKTEIRRLFNEFQKTGKLIWYSE
ncbi:MAG: hypothetical protein SFU87_13020 [Chitinophagaceae bacterium]|nr:hypothetical protein [Chitinophagaceae bacterium]